MNSIAKDVLESVSHEIYLIQQKINVIKGIVGNADLLTEACGSLASFQKGLDDVAEIEIEKDN